MDCDCLIHPFQNDPGTSQAQRVMDELLGGAAKIDARTLADLLDYFVQMSRHVNFFHPDLTTGDWQPFFRKSIPFTLASVIKFPLAGTLANLQLYQTIYNKKPGSSGLQLLVHSVFYRFINPINTWQQILEGSSLPVSAVVDSQIKNKLVAPVKQFIRYANAAVKTYQVARIDFQPLASNPVWALDALALSDTDSSFSDGTISARQRMDNLYADFSSLVTVFSDAVKTLSASADKSLEASFVPLKQELQKMHSPHLALLFAFLNMFRQLQDDLNQYTKRHLDYFYKDILQFRAAGAVPDKAHVVFEIQKALKSYLVKKGLRVKDGKDVNKQDILFSLDDDIVVTQATVADKRTLFLNNQTLLAQTYVEGVYMAPVAGMADGVAIDFADDPKNFPAVGARLSKYADPETKLLKPYPNARLGFVLASPVLLMQTGSTRSITIDLPCRLSESLCADLENMVSAGANDCCGGTGLSTTETVAYPSLYRAGRFFGNVNDVLNQTYYYINEDIIRAAVKKGISGKLADWLRETFLTDTDVPDCYCPVKTRKFENTVTTFLNDIAGQSPGEQQILIDLVKPRKLFSIQLSGEKSWIVPAEINALRLDPPALPGLPPFEFVLHIAITLTPDQESVAAYNEKTLNERLGTTQPLVKLLLDDRIKMTGINFAGIVTPPDSTGDCCRQDSDCCLLLPATGGSVSLYHFFRNVSVTEMNLTNKDKTIISVTGCGLKKFIVQNDESVMDVNGPVYPFGARPEILNFDAANPPLTPLVGPAFFIGSDEIFFKKWDSFRINLKWKDIPADFSRYYEAYFDGGLDSNKFLISLSALQTGSWKKLDGLKKLFDSPVFGTIPPGFPPGTPLCDPVFVPDFHYTVFSHGTGFSPAFIPGEQIGARLGSATQDGFIKINLINQDFLHKDYSFVLARQMMAFGRYPDLINGAIYKVGGTPIVFDIKAFFGNIGPEIIALAKQVVDDGLGDVIADILDIIKNELTLVSDIPFLNDLENRCSQLIKRIAAVGAVSDATVLGGFNIGGLLGTDQQKLIDEANAFFNDLFQLVITDLGDLKATLASRIKGRFDAVLAAIDVNGLFAVMIGSKEVLIPKEPWTPVLSNISLDYTASAAAADIDLIHLYPYDNTYKTEALVLRPTLFPTFCDEGTLFLGLKDLVPGDNLNLLFQMAEATSDSESDPETVFWYYLDGNNWKPLRNGFEVLTDGTKNLTRTGIVKLALPANMNKDNTVMPPDLCWIKAGIPKNSGAVSETIAILTQAAEVTFTNETTNDKKRLGTPLPGGSLSRLEIADASVKSVSQPYDAFGGIVPELQQQFYVRVSETLRHKGRAIQAFDYERLVLEAFPQLFKAKCINHSFALNAHEYKYDYPYAGGYVLMAVIPDLNQLKAGNAFEPRVPVSILEDIDTFIRKRSSPFVRFRAMNPRYEQVRFCLKIRLLKGKDENYFREQVKSDLRAFLAPWAVGDYYKLTFGQCVYRSDVIQFLETRDYMDFISDLQMNNAAGTADPSSPKICPGSPRSILIAGDIEVCIDEPDCPQWGTYTGCNQQPVSSCDTKPLLISNYCK